MVAIVSNFLNGDYAPMIRPNRTIVYYEMQIKEKRKAPINPQPLIDAIDYVFEKLQSWRGEWNSKVPIAAI